MNDSQILKLYTVTLECTAVVLATSERDAENVFRSNQGNILAGDGADICCDGEIKDEDDLPSEWEVECQPYGGTHNRTIAEWLDLAPPEVVRDSKTIDMFAQVAP